MSDTFFSKLTDLSELKNEFTKTKCFMTHF